jgi:formylglycine-generating enzyme required for sulfatase activity
VSEWDALPEPPTTGWEVTTILACGLSTAPAKFIEAVRLINPALAGRCLDEAGIAGDGLEEVRKKVRADLLSALYDPAVHLRARLQAGLVLGRIGDPRFEAQEINGVKVILPQMVNVPAGSYLIGSVKGEEDSFEQEYPQHTTELKAFSIGKWSVTNAEFACFMNAGGYQNEKYWQGDLALRWLKGEDVSGGQFATWLTAWKQLQELKKSGDVRQQLEKSGNFTPEQMDSLEYVAGLTEDELKSELGKSLSQKSRSQPAFWNDRERNNPSQPVVGITWFEARAYCAWLSEVTGENYRLPTEVEWEAAARGLPDKPLLGKITARKYPWGNDWDQEKANSLEGRVLKPSPVGAYSATGAVGPFGAEDQAGNVYDWTSSLNLPYPYDAKKSEQEESTDERVVRGGSWLYNRRNVRCAGRNRGVPGFFNDDIGFRLVSPGSDDSSGS